MFPRIKKTTNNFTFDARLKEEELALFKDCIGKSIQTLSTEHLHMKLNPLKLSCFKKVALTFKSDGTSHASFIFTSLYDEVRELICDQGAVVVQKIVTERKKLKEILLLPAHELDKSFVVRIDYPIQSPLKSVNFYGSHQQANIKKIDINVDLDYLKGIGYQHYPDVTIDSIEFIILKHESNENTILSLETGGFYIHLNNSNPQKFINEHYKKDIILQHQIS